MMVEILFCSMSTLGNYLISPYLLCFSSRVHKKKLLKYVVCTFNTYFYLTGLDILVVKTSFHLEKASQKKKNKILIDQPAKWHNKSNAQ